jgi:hypothetical protein
MDIYRRNLKMKKWLLRLNTDSFIMVVNSETNEYKNIYAKNIEERLELKELAKTLEKHKNYKIND